MKQVIRAYRQVSATDAFKEIERSRTRHNEAAALGHARNEERQKWQVVVAGMDAAIAEKDALIAELQAKVANLTER